MSQMQMPDLPNFGAQISKMFADMNMAMKYGQLMSHALNKRTGSISDILKEMTDEQFEDLQEGIAVIATAIVEERGREGRK